MCRVMQKWCKDGIPAESWVNHPPVKNARQEDKTNYVGDDTLADKMQIVDPTDRYMRTAEITNSWQFEKLIELLLMEKRKSSLQVYRQREEKTGNWWHDTVDKRRWGIAMHQDNGTADSQSKPVNVS